MRDGVATALLKYAVVICFGVGCQRAAEAAPAGDAEFLAAPNSQQATPQDSLRTARQPSLKLRRRKPRMAGVPVGLQTVLAQAPEPAFPVAAAQEAQGVGVSAAARVLAQEVPKNTAPALPQVAAREEPVLPGTGKDAAPEEDEDMESPGAIARRKAEHAQGLTERHYRRAPIKWGGTVTETLAWRNSSTLGAPNSALTQMTHVQTVMVGGTTYILQPWIASVFGRAGIVSGSGNSVYAGGSNQARENSLIGGGVVQLFARSRFPFVLTYDATDSRADDTSNGSLTGTATNRDNSVSKRLNLDQTYRPLNSDDFYKLSFNRNDTLSSQLQDRRPVPITSRETESAFNGEYITRLGKNRDQPFNLTMSNSASSSSSSIGLAMRSRVSNVAAQHTYMPEDSLLTLNSEGNLFQSTLARLSSRNLMLGTRGSWQPEDEDIPLVLRGSARLFQAQNVSGGVVSKTQTMTANITGTYNAWERVTLTGGGSVARAKIGRVSSMSTTQFVNVGYNPPTVNLGKGMPYTRSASAGALNQTSSTGGANFAVFGNAQHALVLPYEFKLFGYGSKFSSNISQGVSARVDRLSGASETLTHAGSIAWSPSLSKALPRIDEGGTEKIKTQSGGLARMINNVTFTLSDARTFGRTPAHVRTMRLSGALMGTGRYRAAAAGYGGNANVSMEVVRQSRGPSTTAVVGKADWAYRYAYEYTYKKPKLFNVRGLEYALTFKANAGTGVNAGVGSAGAQATRTTSYSLGYGFTVDQTLRYRIGQNEALLTASLADNYGVTTASLFMRFRAWRNFGN